MCIVLIVFYLRWVLVLIYSNYILSDWLMKCVKLKNVLWFCYVCYEYLNLEGFLLIVDWIVFELEIFFMEVILEMISMEIVKCVNKEILFIYVWVI